MTSEQHLKQPSSFSLKTFLALKFLTNFVLLFSAQYFIYLEDKTFVQHSEFLTSILPIAQEAKVHAKNLYLIIFFPNFLYSAPSIVFYLNKVIVAKIWVCEKKIDFRCNFVPFSDNFISNYDILTFLPQLGRRKMSRSQPGVLFD